MVMGAYKVLYSITWVQENTAPKPEYLFPTKRKAWVDEAFLLVGGEEGGGGGGGWWGGVSGRRDTKKGFLKFVFIAKRSVADQICCFSVL